MASTNPTPWAVRCPDDGQVFMTRREYLSQLRHANSVWLCPECGRAAWWDEDNYEDWISTGIPPDMLEDK